jgi:hypothetical protein
MKEKLWPLIARMLHANKRNIPKLYEDINKKIDKNFVTDPIIQNTNEISIKVAAALWRPLEPDEMKTHEVQSYPILTVTSLLIF